MSADLQKTMRTLARGAHRAASQPGAPAHLRLADHRKDAKIANTATTTDFARSAIDLSGSGLCDLSAVCDDRGPSTSTRMWTSDVGGVALGR